jgi:hypothetical protein
VEKIRRNRPLNSLKARCREVSIESWKEASQVGEQENGSCRETLLYFAESSRGEWTDEIFGRDFTRFQEPLDLPEVQVSYNTGVERVRSLGGAVSLIQVGQIHWIVHEIVHQDLVRKVP